MKFIAVCKNTRFVPRVLESCKDSITVYSYDGSAEVPNYPVILQDFDNYKLSMTGYINMPQEKYARDEYHRKVAAFHNEETDDPNITYTDPTYADDDYIQASRCAWKCVKDILKYTPSNNNNIDDWVVILSGDDDRCHCDIFEETFKESSSFRSRIFGIKKK